MIIDDILARKIIQPRPLKSHKGIFGRVLLIGGLYPYGGAIIMAALATVKSGAGLVTVATDQTNISALHAHLPETMAFNVTDRKRLTQQIQAADLVLIGPGLGDSEAGKAALSAVQAVARANQVLVVDGSAIDLLAEQSPISWPISKLILTPHQKEWERLSGISISEQTVENTQAALTQFPPATILVAKSHQTKIFDQKGHLGELRVGGPYQATGGMGDTLAGMIAGLAAQFRDNLFETVATAVYLHSAIADDLSKDNYVVLPTAISRELPKWMKEMSGKKPI
ncbi:NAD(P)H-hydrate dehydratase [Streptococcus dentasini]